MEKLKNIFERVIFGKDPLQPNIPSSLVCSARNSSPVFESKIGTLHSVHSGKPVGIPPEMLHYIFEHSSVHDLKQFRLVNKVWNIGVCRVLQQTTCVHFRYDSKNRVRRFVKLLYKIQEGDTPCPFNNIHLHLSKLDSEWVDLVLSLTARKLSVVHFRLSPKNPAENLDLADNMNQLLPAIASTLVYLDCTLRAPVPLDWERMMSRSERAPLYLPALKGLNYDDTDVPSFHSEWKEFLVDVVRGSPNLAALNVVTFDAQVFNAIMRSSTLGNLEEVFIQDFSPQHFKLFSALQLPKLRTLNLDVIDVSEGNMLSSEELKEIVRNFSPTLEEMSVNWVTSSNVEGSFPYCPRLRQLTVDNWPGSFGLFNAKELPSLETLTVYEEIEGTVENFLITDPHEGVENLRWVGNPKEEEMLSVSPEVSEKRVYTMVYLSLQFPNLKYLNLTCAASDEMIRTIVTHMSQLEVFDLTTDSALSESVFTGINKYTLLHYLDAEISIDSCIRTTSLTDMQHLKKLSLHSSERVGFRLSNNALAFGVAEMPSLEHLHLDWTDELEVQVLLRNFSHLSALVIRYHQDLLSTETLVDMKIAMPQIKFELIA